MSAERAPDEGLLTPLPVCQPWRLDRVLSRRRASSSCSWLTILSNSIIRSAAALVEVAVVGGDPPLVCFEGALK